MPYFFCETCEKILERNQQRRNVEHTTTPTGVTLVQLDNIPGSPVIGKQNNTATARMVVRCRECGSDAVERLTPDEEAERQTKVKEDAEERKANMKLVFFVIAFIVVIVVIFWVTLNY